MPTPSQPKDHPPPEQKTETNPGPARNAIPHAQSDAEPKGGPTSDRQDTETAAT